MSTPVNAQTTAESPRQARRQRSSTASRVPAMLATSQALRRPHARPRRCTDCSRRGCSCAGGSTPRCLHCLPPPSQEYEPAQCGVAVMPTTCTRRQRRLAHTLGADDASPAHRAQTCNRDSRKFALRRPRIQPVFPPCPTTPYLRAWVRQRVPRASLRSLRDNNQNGRRTA